MANQIFCTKKSSMRFKAFTLIELLVVISIIALLLAILIPSLKLAKQKAATAVCLTNNKNLALAWYMYQDENNGLLVGGNMSKTAGGKPIGWIRKPRTEAGDERDWWYNNLVTHDDEIRGIESGSLYSYFESVSLLHCPADNIRRNFFYPPDSKSFVSYTIVDSLNGRGISYNSVSSAVRPKVITKFARIKSPSSRYNFIEAAEERPYNGEGTFIMGISDQSKTNWYQSRGFWWTWWAPLAINHGNSSTFGYCDGHAEVNKWHDEHTIFRVKGRLIQNNGTYGHDYDRPPNQIEDIDFMIKRWPLGQ